MTLFGSHDSANGPFFTIKEGRGKGEGTGPCLNGQAENNLFHVWSFIAYAKFV